MFLIKLLLVISVLFLYSLFARACLKLLKIPATIQSVGIFVASGVIAGVVSFIVYGAVLAEQQGHIGHEPQILNMLSVSLLIGVVVSMVTVKVVSPNK